MQSLVIIESNKFSKASWKIVTELKRNSRLEVILKVKSKVKDSFPELKLILSRDIRSTVTISSSNNALNGSTSR